MISDDELQRMANVGRDFIKNEGKQPTLDEFLDYRIYLEENKNKGDYPECFYQLEIDATDEILRRLTRYNNSTKE